MQIFEKRLGNKLVQTARIVQLSTGKYGFETRLLKGRYELNMNIPLFETNTEALSWMATQKNWNLTAP